MKRKSLLLAACLVAVVCTIGNAQAIPGGSIDLVSIEGPGNSDTLLYGTTVTFNFAITNNTSDWINGVSCPFEIRTDNGSGYTLTPDVARWIDSVTPYFWMWASVIEAGGNGNPDTLAFVATGGFSPCFYPGQTIQAISFTVTFATIEEGAPTQFCIDSSLHPVTGDWCWEGDDTVYWPAADWSPLCFTMAEARCGDMDGDMSINIYDMTYIARYFFKGGAAPVVLGAADVNCDGNVNVTDLGYMVAYMFNNGPAPCENCP